MGWNFIITISIILCLPIYSVHALRQDTVGGDDDNPVFLQRQTPSMQVAFYFTSEKNMESVKIAWILQQLAMRHYGLQ